MTHELRFAPNSNSFTFALRVASLRPSKGAPWHARSSSRSSRSASSALPASRARPPSYPEAALRSCTSAEAKARPRRRYARLDVAFTFSLRRARRLAEKGHAARTGRVRTCWLLSEPNRAYEQRLGPGCVHQNAERPTPDLFCKSGSRAPLWPVTPGGRRAKPCASRGTGAQGHCGILTTSCAVSSGPWTPRSTDASSRKFVFDLRCPTGRYPDGWWPRPLPLVGDRVRSLSHLTPDPRNAKYFQACGGLWVCFLLVVPAALYR